MTQFLPYNYTLPTTSPFPPMILKSYDNTMSVIPLTNELLSATDLQSRTRHTLSTRPFPFTPSSLPPKHHLLQCTLKNATQFPLAFGYSHLRAGEYWTLHPTHAAAFDSCVFDVCNAETGDGGVAGGNSFRLAMGGMDEFNFALGWTSTTDGEFRVGVQESWKPEDGFESAGTLGRQRAVSRNVYSGKDSHGRSVWMEFHLTADSGFGSRARGQPLMLDGAEAIFTITQVVVDPERAKGRLGQEGRTR